MLLLQHFGYNGSTEAVFQVLEDIVVDQGGVEAMLNTNLRVKGNTSDCFAFTYSRHKLMNEVIS
jgi:hypothetical protein